MKKIFILFFILFTFSLFAQEEKVEETTNKPIKIETDSTLISKTFFQNGNLKAENIINKKELTGIKTAYYENGNKFFIEKFTVSDIDSKKMLNRRVISVWDKNNIQTVANGNGSYTFENKDYKTTGTYLNGLENGIWKKIVGNNTYTDLYKDGKFISGTKKDENNKITIYKELETSPKFKISNADFNNFIIQKVISHYKYGGDIYGKIILEITVSEDGKIVEPKIIQGINNELDNYILEIVTQYKGINPGYQRGTPIRCKYKLPISFDIRY